MRVVKRNGESEDVSFDKVLNRLKKLSDNLNVNVYDVAQKVCGRIYDNVKTSELDELAAYICSSSIIDNPDYGTLAAKIIISNHHKNTSPSFSETMSTLYNHKGQDDQPNPLINDDLYHVILKHKTKLNSYIDYSRDYTFDYFGFKTLEKSYLIRVKGQVIERPQHLFMRVSLAIHGNDIKDVLKTYDLMSKKYFIHATPTLFNAGTFKQQLSSCFLLGSNSDSIEGIFENLKECAHISKFAGGIGFHIHDIRSKGSKIRGTNGQSSGVIPMLRVFNNAARYVNQGSRRNGSIAVYIEPWHADIYEFLDLKKPHGNEEERARDLFYALWIPDLFMERVKNNEMWSLMCPDTCKRLSDTYGDEFTALYEHYEKEKKYIRQVKAHELWYKILESQIETGTPYIMYKDACNKKSNQQNLGVIKSSNLCVGPQTMILTDKGYYPIVELEKQATTVNVWNGKQFSKTKVVCTGIRQKLLTISFNNGMEIKCTPYHKFYVVGEDKCEPKMIDAKDLEINMKIIPYTLPIFTDPERELMNAYYFGLYAGKCAVVADDGGCGQFDFVGETLNNEYFVPLNYSVQTKVAWFKGLIDNCGMMVDNLIIVIHNTNYDFLCNVLLMLQSLGVKSKIKNKEIIIIDSENIQYLSYLGLYNPDRIGGASSAITGSTIVIDSVKVKSVQDHDEYDNTYCFNEPLEHKGIFNGILTGQCTEIVEYSSPEEVAVCNLASICLPTYVCYDDENKPYFDFKTLYEVTEVVTKNLNKVIDTNFYPLEKARRSNLKHRPIGIGVQGLADAFILMRQPFDSDDAKRLNIRIFETIYHAALTASMNISKKRASYMKEYVTLDHKTKRARDIKLYLKPNEFDPPLAHPFPGAYSSFDGSPASKGILQFDMWAGADAAGDTYLTLDWETLKSEISQWGLRNSLLLAPMPTASTSQIMGFNECFEPLTSNIYKRKTLAGEFILVNKYLIKDLISLNLWNSKVKNNIIIDEGSVQGINEIPQDIKDLYKTVWEIKQKVLIDMAADRGRFICQSQSMNLFLESPDFKKLTSMHFYSWQKGLKTGCYYLRSKPKAKQQKFTVDPSILKMSNIKCTEDVCTMCSS